MKQIHALKTEQEHYKEVMSPFEEFLPLTRPSDSEDYLRRLASKMREHGLTERQQPILKNMLQLPSVDEYKLYASTSVAMRRYASLAGSSNEMTVIKDLTGSRRYLCIKVTGKIKFPKRINYAQLYAEAVHEINGGTRYWLNEAEEKALTERNLRFVCMPPEIQRTDRVFDIVPLGTPGARWYYAADINKRLHPTINKPMTATELRRLSIYMNSQHAATRRGKAGMQYFLLEKDDNQ